MFRLNAPVIIRAKVEEVQTNIAIHVIGSQWSTRIPPPSLPGHYSGYFPT